MHVRIRGLSAETFTHLFALDDEALARHEAVRMRAPAGSHPPCRISLTDAEPGEEVLLVNHEHHAVASPYRARFAIFVRPGETTYDEIDHVPEQLARRLLAVRAYDARAMLCAAEITEGKALAPALERMLSDPNAAYLHVHFAKPGCYAALVERA